MKESDWSCNSNNRNHWRMFLYYRNINDKQQFETRYITFPLRIWRCPHDIVTYVYCYVRVLLRTFFNQGTWVRRTWPPTTTSLTSAGKPTTPPSARRTSLRRSYDSRRPSTRWGWPPVLSSPSSGGTWPLYSYKPPTVGTH